MNERRSDRGMTDGEQDALHNRVETNASKTGLFVMSANDR
jgi:hypothetical protein